MRKTRLIYDKLTADQGGPLASLLRGPLWLASIGYRSLIAARNARYDRDPSKTCRVCVPVISVGNITTGGTGKTPVVIDVVTRLQKIGYKPAVVSRGYGSGPSQPSDELMLIERSVPGVVCVASPDRVAGAEQAVTKHDADVIVLDDGFQHRRIARDLDIVLIDATQPFGFGHLLPRGHLREPIGNIARADMLIVTRADQVDRSALERLVQRIDALAGGRRRLVSIHKPQPLRPLRSGLPQEDPIESGSAYLVSGIGNPDAFRCTVDSLGMEVCGHTRFDDHHRYSATDALDVCAKAAGTGARFLVVTEKDAVKLELLAMDWPLPVWVLCVRIDFCKDGDRLMDQALRETMVDSC